MEKLTWGSVPFPPLHICCPSNPPISPPSHPAHTTTTTPSPLLPCLQERGLWRVALWWREARWQPQGRRRGAEQRWVHTYTHTPIHNHSLTLSLLNEQPWIIHHTHLHTHASRRAHTQLLSATEGSATSLYFIIISLGIFLGCKGIPGGARPLKLSTPPPSSFPFPPACTLSLVLPSPSESSLSSSLNLFFSFSHCLFLICGSSRVGCITGANKERERRTVNQREDRLPRGLRRIHMREMPGALLLSSSQGCSLSQLTQSVDYLSKYIWEIQGWRLRSLLSYKQSGLDSEFDLKHRCTLYTLIRTTLEVSICSTN